MKSYYFTAFCFLFLTLILFQSTSGKQFCWSCQQSNGTTCSRETSTKIRCADVDYVTFICYERQYNVSAGANYVTYSERNCLRYDMFRAGWPCKDKTDCFSKMCFGHMCNSSFTLKVSTATILISAIIGIATLLFT